MSTYHSNNYHKFLCLLELRVYQNFGPNLPVGSDICSFDRVLIISVPNLVHILVPCKKIQQVHVLDHPPAPFYATQQAQHKTTTTSCLPLSPW